MSIRYRVVRVCEQANWEIVSEGIIVKLETQSLPLTFTTKEQAKKWIDFINARTSNGLRKRKARGFKYNLKKLETLAFGRHSPLNNTNAKRAGAENTILINTNHRLNAILKNSTGE